MDTIRRVVTGHDESGRPVVLYDGPAGNATSSRPGQEAVVIWTTNVCPPNNDGDLDTGRHPLEGAKENGTFFQIIEYQPGVQGRLHRTNSLDYALVLRGSIDMQLDDGLEVHFEAGDVLVQRGTIHNWINRGTEPCRIAFVWLSAKPVVVNGQSLPASG